MNKDEILESIKGMSVLDLAELVKALEEEFGVSAAAPVAMAPTNVKEAVSQDVADEAKEKLEGAGAVIEVS